MPAFELRKLSTTREEVLVCLLQIQLGVRQCETIDFFEPYKLLFVLGRSREFLLFKGFFVVLELLIGFLSVSQHFIVDETNATESFRKKLLLFLRWVQTELICFVCHIESPHFSLVKIEQTYLLHSQICHHQSAIVYVQKPFILYHNTKKRQL